jgi:hypothetical protein
LQWRPFGGKKKRPTTINGRISQSHGLGIRDGGGVRGLFISTFRQTEQLAELDTLQEGEKALNFRKWLNKEFKTCSGSLGASRDAQFTETGS